MLFSLPADVSYQKKKSTEVKMLEEVVNRLTVPSGSSAHNHRNEGTAYSAANTCPPYLPPPPSLSLVLSLPASFVSVPLHARLQRVFEQRVINNKIAKSTVYLHPTIYFSFFFRSPSSLLPPLLANHIIDSSKHPHIYTYTHTHATRHFPASSESQ
jgi:hypothetical protein